MSIELLGDYCIRELLLSLFAMSLKLNFKAQHTNFITS